MVFSLDTRAAHSVSPRLSAPASLMLSISGTIARTAASIAGDRRQHPRSLVVRQGGRAADGAAQQFGVTVNRGQGSLQIVAKLVEGSGADPLGRIIPLWT